MTARAGRSPEDGADTNERRIARPWRDEGWYSELSLRRTPPEIRELIVAAGRGVNPVTYFEGRAVLAWSPATHNPYLGTLLSGVFIATGVFLFVAMGDVPWAAGLVGGLFVACGLFVLVQYARRIPGWHRARRVVGDHIRTHGGEFPRELRWYT